MRIWIDTDLGTDVDDALALAYAVHHPEIELVGVSTVFGDVELRTRMAQRLLELSGASEVPVLTGLGKPLTDERPGLMLGHEGLGLLDDPDPRRRTVENENAEERIDAMAAAMAEARPEFLVAIGPMTNVGALAAANAALPPLAIMGGKIEDVALAGTIPGIEEWNWFCDPIAVQHTLVAQNPRPPRVVPAEVTWQTELVDGDVERLAEGGTLARVLSTLCDEWLTAQRDRLGVKKPRVALHDPLTLATLVEPGLCPFEHTRIRIDDRGCTTRETDGAEIEVATDVDPGALRAHLMDVWLTDAP